jgi:putative flippase GtrA
MTDLLRKLAAACGLEAQLEKHAHHVPRIGRVLVIGGIGFVIQTTLFEVLGIWMHVVAPSTATAIGALCAIASNFALNERYSFHDAIDRSVPLYTRVVKFYFVSSGSMLTQWICLLVVEQFTMSPLVLNGAFVVGVGIGFILNYAGYYFFVWRRQNEKIDA